MRDLDQQIAAGTKEYGERKNAKEKCARCGASIGEQGALGVKHGNDKYCVDCAVEKGFIDKADVENETPLCKCGHDDEHHMAGGECETCDCTQFRRT